MEKKKIIEEKKNNIYIVIEWLIHMILYAFVLCLMSLIFPNTIYIDKENFGLWALLTTILISILNQTIKPLIFWLTLPITGITLGLFYPFINLLILKLVSLITFGHFEIYGIFMALIVSIIISFLNIMVDNILKKMVEK